MTFDFQSYLASIRTTYAKWWEYYTLTDATGKQRQSREDSPFFDFGLMVQTVKREERDRQTEEKVERFSVLDGLRKYADQQVLLVGRPGSGKSTALARLMLEEATNQQARIPILVELRYWQGSIEQLIRDSLIRHEMPAEQVETALKHALILFDGVNELPSEEARSQLSAFRRNHPKLPMIFTTRDLSIGGDLGIEKKLEMQPLSEEQMRKFVRAYVPEQAEQMLRQLKARLRELGQTPLLLWMLCSLFQRTGTIPENLGLVFRGFTQGYEQYLKEDVRIESDKAWWKPVLQQLAWVMMQGEKPTEFRVAIRFEEAVGAIEQFLDGKVPYAENFARKCLRDLQKYHLIQAGANQEELEFQHQLIQEYYAAEALLNRIDLNRKDRIEDEQLKRDFLNFLKWTQPIALMLALTNGSQAVQVVKLALQCDLKLGSTLAGKVNLEFQEQAIRLIETIDLPNWLRIQLLGRTCSNAAIPTLLTLLENSDAVMRRSAVIALGKIESEDVIPVLLERLVDSDATVRESAFEALGEIELEDIIILLELLEDSFVRRSAVIALSKIESEDVIPALLKLLEDPDAIVRESAALALGEIGSEDVIPALLKLLEDPDAIVRESLAAALGKIGSEAAVSILLKLLENSDSYTCRSAALALGEIGSEDVIPALLKLLEDPDAIVRESAALALGEIGSEDVIPALLKLLEDPDAIVRESLAAALGKISSEDVIPALLKLLEDSNFFVRENSALTLGEIGSEDVIPALLKLLEDPVMRGSIVVALGKIESTTVISILLKLLEDSNAIVRSSAALALGKTECNDIIPALLKLLEDSNAIVRSSVAAALGEIEPETVVPALLKLLEDSDVIVCWRAAAALGNIAGKHADRIIHHLPYLLTLIPTDSGQVAFDVILAIQENCKYYNYEIYQAYLEAQKHDRQTPQNSDLSSPKINQFPNVTEVKIFENVDRYYETPPKDPPS